MRKLFLSFCGVLCIAYGQAKQTNGSDLPTVIFKFSPQHMIRSGMWLSAEIFNQQHSASNQISLEGIYSKPVDNTFGLIESTGFTAEYMFRYYTDRLHIQKNLKKEYVKGFYVGLFGQAGSYSQKSNYSGAVVQTKSTTFYPGFIFGLQQSIADRVYLDFYLGAGMHISNRTVDPSGTSYRPDNAYMIYTNGILPKVGLSLGIGI